MYSIPEGEEEGGGGGLGLEINLKSIKLIRSAALRFGCTAGCTAALTVGFT